MRISGVGSLPHTDAFEAAAFVHATTDLPYLPQLPNRHPSEGLLRQWADGLCGAGGTADGVGLRWGEPVGERAEAFGGAAAMLATVDGPQIKTQFTGPVTLILGLLAAGCPSEGLWDCVVTGLGERLGVHIGEIWTALPDVEVGAIMDEPARVIYAPGRPQGPIPIEASAEAMARVMADAPVRVGIHVCADTEWGMVAGLDPAWISWDLAALGDGFFSATDVIAEKVSQGTGIMWGMVPTEPSPIGIDRIRSRYGTAVTRLVLEGAPADRLMATSIATPACGLAGTTIGGAAVVMEHVHEVVEALDD